MTARRCRFGRVLLFPFSKAPDLGVNCPKVSDSLKKPVMIMTYKDQEVGCEEEVLDHVGEEPVHGEAGGVSTQLLPL